MIGYRVWRVGHGKLLSLTSSFAWTPGINTAECHCTELVYLDESGITCSSIRSDHPHSPASGPDAGCGLWMREQSEELFDGDLGGFEVCGQVEAWGTCIRHEKGWRCEKMRILSLIPIPWDRLAPWYRRDYQSVPAYLDILRGVSVNYDVPLA